MPWRERIRNRYGAVFTGAVQPSEVHHALQGPQRVRVFRASIFDLADLGNIGPPRFGTQGRTYSASQNLRLDYLQRLYEWRPVADDYVQNRQDIYVQLIRNCVRRFLLALGVSKSDNWATM
jgi:hypothetical protein